MLRVAFPTSANTDRSTASNCTLGTCETNLFSTGDFGPHPSLKPTLLHQPTLPLLRYPVRQSPSSAYSMTTLSLKWKLDMRSAVVVQYCIEASSAGRIQKLYQRLNYPQRTRGSYMLYNFIFMWIVTLLNE